MTTPDWIPPIHPDRIWRYTAPTGEVLATLEHDADSGQYRSGGVPVGANWNDAKAKCEQAAKRSRK